MVSSKLTNYKETVLCTTEPSGLTSFGGSKPIKASKIQLGFKRAIEKIVGNIESK